MAARQDLGQQKYWFYGTPVDEIKRTNKDLSTQKYWRYGTSSAVLYLKDKPKNFVTIIVS